MAADRDEGQIVEYAPRSPRQLARLRQELNLANPPTGIVPAAPLSASVLSWAESRTRRGKTVTKAYQLTDGAILAALGVLAIYELDKAVSAWAGSLGADLQGLNPLNWLVSGANAQTAMADLKAAAAAAAANPPTASSPGAGGSSGGGGGGSTVPSIVADRLDAQQWDLVWQRAWAQLRGHRFEIPPTL